MPTSHDRKDLLYVAGSPLHGEGLFANKAFKKGDIILTHRDAAKGLCPPSWKVNSSGVLPRPPSGIGLSELIRMLVTYKVDAEHAANATVDVVGVIALRDIRCHEEIVYAYCPLTWLIEYIDEEPLLETRLNYIRALDWEHGLRIANCVPLHNMNLRRLGCKSWKEVEEKLSRNPHMKIGLSTAM
jgi:hypothetical protein